MTVKRTSAETLVRAAEGMAGPACAAALKKVKSLASAAPSGRAFAAIATLADFSQSIESHLTAGAASLRHGDGPKAESEWARAALVMDEMAAEARGNRSKRAGVRLASLRRR